MRLPKSAQNINFGANYRAACRAAPYVLRMKRKTAKIDIRVEPRLVERIDAWRARRHVPSSRAAAIVYMLEHFLEHDPPELEKIDSIRSKRLAADLFNALRPTLGIPPCRENAYVALDALAWTAAIILIGTEDRDALDFFTLALTQNLADIEEPKPTSDNHDAPAVR
jgi:hypothetical protein